MTTIQTEFAIKSLQKKYCPLHNIAMDEITPFTTPDLSYIRHRFRCPVSRCRCLVDFVGDEIKTDSIDKTMGWLSCLELSDDLEPLR